jgi:hypothetical protein
LLPCNRPRSCFSIPFPLLSDSIFSRRNLNTKNAILILAALTLTSVVNAKEGAANRKLASSATSEASLRAVVSKSVFLKQVVAYARKTAGKGAQCGELNIQIDKNNSSATINGSCNYKQGDAESSVLFEVKGIIFESSNTLMIENVKFDYAG